MLRLLVFALTALLSAQQQKPGSIRGQVLSMTGEPLRKAEVTLRGSGRGANASATTTDSSGVFAFDNVPAGNYLVSAQRNGFVRSNSPGVTVAAGQEVTGGTIKLTPHSVIAGKVVDEDGEPLIGAMVAVSEERYVRGKRTLNTRSSTNVNDLGEYRLYGLPPGRYYLSVDPRRQFGPPVNRTRESNLALVTVYYPGVIEQSQATPITLTPGQEARGIDLQVRRVPTVHVRGIVTDENGAPTQNASIMVLNGDSMQNGPMNRHMSPVRPDGAFDVPGLTPGSYTLVAQRAARDRGRSTGVAQVQVGTRDVEGVSLRMIPGATIAGVIRTEENVNVQNVRITLDPVEGLPFDMHSSRTVGEGNTFTVPDVGPGRYRVDAVGAPDGYYLKSVQISGQDVTESGLTVSGAVGGLEVILAKGAGAVEGTVADAEGKPFSSAIVSVVPPQGKRDQWRLFKTAMSDQTGKFTVRNLTPGDYTLLAFDSTEDAAAVQNPEQLKQIESKGATVKLGENGHESAQLKIIE